MRSVSWNYRGYFFEFGSGLLLLAYVVRRVTVHDYGIYLLAQSLAAFLFLSTSEWETYWCRCMSPPSHERESRR